MFCSGCGAKIALGSAKCPQCGEVLGFGGSVSAGNAFKGFILLLVSWFTMPLRTLKITLVQLRELGGKGSLDVKDTETPHLRWLGIAYNFLSSLVIVCILIIGALKGIDSLKAWEYSKQDAIKGFILSPIIGVFVAIAADWLIMIWLEILLLMVYIAKDIKKIANKG